MSELAYLLERAQEMRMYVAFALFGVTLTTLAVCLFIIPAHARWVGPPQELADMTALPGASGWFIGLMNKKGGFCCSDADGNKPEAVWDNTDNPNYPYKVKLEGQWIEVPVDAVITEPNRVGIAIVWYSVTRSESGPPTFYIRCFLPGSLI